jgi:hypothetical protein
VVHEFYANQFSFKLAKWLTGIFIGIKLRCSLKSGVLDYPVEAAGVVKCGATSETFGVPHGRGIFQRVWPGPGGKPVFKLRSDGGSFAGSDWRETMSNSASGEAAKAVVRRNTEEVQGKGNFDVFEELFADDFVDHTPQPAMTPTSQARAASTRPFGRPSPTSTPSSIGRPPRARS